MRFIKWLNEVDKKDILIVGGKGANLGEVARIVQVPPGFVVTTEAYLHFLQVTGLKEKIGEVLKEFISRGEPDEYEKASAVIRGLIESSPLPSDLEKELVEAYKKLCDDVGVPNVAVAVRSSATAEDIPEASFAGQQDTYLNVRGAENVIYYVKRVWGSLYTARALYYRDKMGIPHEKSLMAVVVQKLVNAKAAGVIFTLDPTNGDRSKVVIEASWGLGEGVVKGIVTPDEYVVDKATGKIVEKRISVKRVAVVRDEAGLVKEIELSLEKASSPALRDEEVVELAKMAVKLEETYGHPVDIEFAVDADIEYPRNLFILQVRPETVWSRKAEQATKAVEEVPVGTVVVRGIPASPGVAVGAAKVCLTLEDAKKKLRKGDILVTKMTDPDWVPYMRIASAIVTDEGGRTSHAAIVSRELGIPAVVGTGNATSVLKDGVVYTVDGSKGVVLQGAVAKKEEAKAVEVVAPPREIILHIYRAVPTGTKVYMNLGEPDKIDEYKDLPFDGIGLMRIEFVISSWISQHPVYLLSIGQEHKFVTKMAEGIAKVASAIYPRPVVVRFSDFKTNEYRGLEGGEKFEPEERNPMLGWRGVSRYVSPQYEKAFRLELRAVKMAREQMGLNNVWVMAPFVRTVWEAERFARLLEEEGLYRDRDFKVWAMSEVPSIALMVEEFAEYFDGFSIGSNDLTQLVLGVDRDNDFLVRINPKYFDEREAPVLKAIYEIIRRAHKVGRTVSICGQGPSVYPQLVEFLVRAGIDSISVNPDAVLQTRIHVASVELKVLRERLDAIYRALYKVEEGAEFYEILKKVFGGVKY
ncbi:phosphoenolpyruvate synthase [Pyrobaculum ferrireducens]|uniref:Phosphoenolpyruvate synthase n=1 Tax=Pyrobaculum ferrireducens TaxID=1104324 RepID=G7VCS5_9CREN|nr:phosphoenolpyruvate synthase [Pyrobaculum ferrireducens]AET32614.1 phosphoenolpyruvate synthase [Pyrobaculum ferrireducens]